MSRTAKVFFVSLYCCCYLFVACTKKESASENLPITVGSICDSKLDSVLEIKLHPNFGCTEMGCGVNKDGSRDNCCNSCSFSGGSALWGKINVSDSRIYKDCLYDCKTNKKTCPEKTIAQLKKEFCATSP